MTGFPLAALAGALLLILAIAWMAWLWWRRIPFRHWFTARIVRVSDGDSVFARCRGSRLIRVRIAGMDAPEHNQPLGRQATERLRELVLKQPVRLYVVDRDRYGRFVAVVDRDGLDVGLAMIREGLAWCYASYLNRLSREQIERYPRAEREAREAQLGLWSLGEQSLEPWEFRRRERVRRQVIFALAMIALLVFALGLFYWMTLK